jgi:hypothetical protein
VTIREGWAEYAVDDATFTKLGYDEGSPRLQLALETIARAAPDRLTYRGVEEILDWPRGRLRSVFSGHARRSKRRWEGRRPWHICPEWLSRSGEWECWMTLDSARPLLTGRGTDPLGR